MIYPRRLNSLPFLSGCLKWMRWVGKPEDLSSLCKQNLKHTSKGIRSGSWRKIIEQEGTEHNWLVGQMRLLCETYEMFLLISYNLTVKIPLCGCSWRQFGCMKTGNVVLLAHLHIYPFFWDVLTSGSLWTGQSSERCITLRLGLNTEKRLGNALYSCCFCKLHLHLVHNMYTYVNSATCLRCLMHL